MKKLILSFILMGQFYFVVAQQEALFTHYMFNSLAVNPGYAGSREALTVTGLHRSQWVSFPGSPKTQTLTIHSPVHSEKIGVGLSVINDEVGIVKTTSVYGDFAYKLKVAKGLLAMGIKGGVNVRSTQLTDAVLKEEDPTFQSDVVSKPLPNFAFGLYYSADRYYVGLSSTKLLLNDFDNNDVSGSIERAREVYHLFLIGGAVFNLNASKTLKIKPTTQIRYAAYSPLTIDINATFMYKDRFWIGPMGRISDGLGGMVGFQFTDQISAGYSFDWSLTNATGKYNDGSHEIMLRYDFIFLNNKTKSPRYF